MTRQVSSFAGTLFACVALFAIAGVSLATAQTETVIHSFQSSSGTDGSSPFGGVVADGTGALYGTAQSGGKYRQGAVYKLSPPTTQGGVWKQNILYSFQGVEYEDGSSPMGNLVLSKSGKIYGTTASGGQYGDGAVFELSPPTQAGKPWTETIIYSFMSSDGSVEPYYGLTAGTGGRLYGTTFSGGRDNAGFVFALSPPSQLGTPWTEATLYNFRDFNGSNSGGASGVILDASGNIYGTTFYGGVAYQLVPPSGGKGAWTENILYTFSGEPGPTGLVFGSAGSLYGATLEGGQFGAGTVYQLSPPTTQGGAWTEQVLYSFGGVSGDSLNPITSLLLDSAGALYGASENGPDSCGEGLYYYCGTVFKVSPPSTQGGSWTEQVLHSFTGGTDGAYIQTPVLVLGTTVYGTTLEGGTGFCENENGPAGCGTVFQITQP
ncbi:MAG: choice-of-anchor tandem repeat GloVer-containing protein [Candidatus Sulfotelmatobacter sp.]|jgi:hypothetical protein